MMQVVLSMFPDIDLLGRWFREVGFCVLRGGDVIYGEDIRDKHDDHDDSEHDDE